MVGTNDPDGVGRRIRELREKLQLTQGQLGAAVGCDARTIWRYETGKGRPAAERLDAIAARLGTSSRWLLWGDEARVEATPAYPALADFIAERKAKKRPLTEERIAQLEAIRWKGVVPTVQTYVFLDKAIDEGTAPDEAAAEEELTATHRARAKAKGMRVKDATPPRGGRRS